MAGMAKSMDEQATEWEHRQIMADANESDAVRSPLLPTRPRRMGWVRFVAVTSASMIYGTMCSLFVSWTSMLWIGIAHGFDARIPAFGYWTMLFLGWTVSAVLTGWRVSLNFAEKISDE